MIGGHRRSYHDTRLTFHVRKVIGGGGGVVAVASCRIILSAPVPFPFLWTLDFGVGFWTGLGLDNNLEKC